MSNLCLDNYALPCAAGSPANRIVASTLTLCFKSITRSRHRVSIPCAWPIAVRLNIRTAATNLYGEEVDIGFFRKIYTNTEMSASGHSRPTVLFAFDPLRTRHPTSKVTRGSGAHLVALGEAESRTTKFRHSLPHRSPAPPARNMDLPPSEPPRFPL